MVSNLSYFIGAHFKLKEVMKKELKKQMKILKLIRRKGFKMLYEFEILIFLDDMGENSERS